MSLDVFTPLRVAAVFGSPSDRSRSRRLLDALLEHFSAATTTCTRIELTRLSADDLLGRTRTRALIAALDAVRDADIIAVSTPVYRATYSGLLKVFFDLLPADALVGKVGLAVATGGSNAHQLVLDHGLRPLLASVGALVVPTLIYACDAHINDTAIDPTVAQRLARAAAEAVTLSRALTDTNTALTGA